MPGLVLANVSKSFAGPRRQNVGAVANLDLTVEAGEFLVIVGPSGCGKTTTLRLIAGLETPDAGDISLEGKSLMGVPPRGREVAMVFQNHALLPHLTVSENLGFGLMLRHFSKEEINQSVRHAAELLNLSPLLDKKPPALSGGECQRVALGRALVRQPKVFLFDEPLSNLDAPMRLQLRGEIAAVHRRVGAMMIYVTHDQGEAMALADRVAVMRDGTLQQIAAALQIYRHPVNRFVASFIGSPPMNFFDGTIARNNGHLVFRGAFEFVLDAASSQLMQRYVDRSIILGVRPEDISEIPIPGIVAVVERLEPTGPEILCYCSSKGAALIMRLSAAHPVKAGDQLSLRFATDRIHFFDSQTGAAIS